VVSFPVLGLTLLSLLYTWPVGAERGGYLLTYCFLILQTGEFNGEEVSVVEDELRVEMFGGGGG
jgi:hypothetical protein